MVCNCCDWGLHEYCPCTAVPLLYSCDREPRVISRALLEKNIEKILIRLAINLFANLILKLGAARTAWREHSWNSSMK